MRWTSRLTLALITSTTCTALAAEPRVGEARRTVDLTDPAERRFWNLWTLAMMAWLTKSLLAFWLDHLEIWTLESDLLLNACYFLFYSFAAIALESRPQLATSRPARLARLTERVGTLVFFFGLALYFAVIPELH